MNGTVEHHLNKDIFAMHAKGLSLRRGETLLFENVSFNITPGQLIWVNGGNGMGKTSLLRLLAGFMRADDGQVSWSHNNQACAARDIVGFQGHYDAFKPALTAAETLTLWADIFDGTARPDLATISDVLSSVGLGHRVDVACGQLSAGQRRRLALARLILSHKQLWIMDEPTAAMDAKGVAIIHSLVEQHIARGGAAVIASHNPAQSIAADTRRLTLSITT